MAGETLAEVIRRLGRSGGLRNDLAETDAQLLERFARRREEGAFAALVARHGPMVLGVCRRLLPNAQDAEDAFQAAFLVLARKAGAIRRRPLLSAWLYGVAWRVAVRLRGRAARRRERFGADLDALPADHAAWSDVRWVVHAEVQRLPDAYRSAVILCCLEGKTSVEAARLLRRPVGTVKSRLTRARELLRTRLARRGMAMSAGAVGTVLAVNAATASAALADATVQAARPFAAGGGVAGGGVSARVIALSQGVVRTMLFRKTTAAAVALMIALLGGAGGLVYRAWAQAPGGAARALAAPADKPAAPADRAKGDREAIQGAWRVESILVDGQEWADDKARKEKAATTIITAEKMIVKYAPQDGGGETVSKYTLDPTRTPKEMDETPIGDAQTYTLPEVYSLDGDTLKICHIMVRIEDLPKVGRPKAVASREGGDTLLLTLKRIPPDKDKPKEDMEALQGVWRVTAMETEGVERDDDVARDVKKQTWTIRGDRLVVHVAAPGPARDAEFTYAIDATQKPKTMDLTSEQAAGASPLKNLHGAYSLDGDVLKFCYAMTGAEIEWWHQNVGKRREGFKELNLYLPAGPRPKEVATKDGSKTTLLTLEREPAAKGGPAKDKPQADADTEKIQGTWVAVSAEMGGKPAPAEAIKDLALVITADTVAFNPDGENRKSNYKLDATKTPKVIELTPLDGPAQGKRMRGLYELDGDQLKLCVQNGEGEEPKGFATKPGTDLRLLILKRKPAEEKPKEDKPKDDLQALQGVWRLVSDEIGGKEQAPPGGLEYEWLVENRSLTLRAVDPKSKDPNQTPTDPNGIPQLPHTSAFTIRPEKNPKEIDINPYPVGPFLESDIHKGIYTLDGDVWKVCLPGATTLVNPPAEAKERPKEMATKPGGYTHICTFRRVRPEDKPKDDKEALQGTWKVVSVEEGGKEATGGRADQERKAEWVVKGGFIGLQSKDPNFVALSEVYAVRPDKDPKEIDINPYPVGAFVESDVDKGIYTLDGDVWKVCLSKWPMDTDDPPRPTQMATKEGGKAVLITLRRVRTEQDKPKEHGPKPHPADPNTPPAGVRSEKEQKLLQDWSEAARKAFNLRRAQYAAGKASADSLFGAAHRLLTAEVERSANEVERVAAYQAHLERMTELAQMAKKLGDAGIVLPADAADAEYYRIEAEILLEGEKAK